MITTKSSVSYRFKCFIKPLVEGYPLFRLIATFYIRNCIKEHCQFQLHYFNTAINKGFYAGASSKSIRKISTTERGVEGV
jgi:hypothetical protein